jgi:PPM family protein phosphatase
VSVAAGRLAAAAGTHPGRQRENNEDRVLCDLERGIYAVVDGVGGESGGEVAAEIALEVLRGRLSRRTADAERLIREAIALANKRILERARQEPRLAGMSCVLTVAVLDGTEATVGHVGDSRLYLLRRGAMRKVTLDHAPVGAREDAGELSEDEAMRHPRRNEIFRDVGSAPHEPDDAEFVEVHRVPFDAESALLLCSDGLTDQVTAGRIREVVEAHAGRPQQAVAELIDAANAAGGRDNVSVVLVEGERFRSAGREAGGPGGAGAGVRGAAYVRPGRLQRMLEGPVPWLVLSLLLALAAVLFLYRESLLQWLRGRFGGPEQPPGPAISVLRVGPGEGSHATLGEALALARPGQTVVAAPGRYGERIEIPDGVALVSVPRGALLVPPAGEGSAPAPPAITARGVRGARLSGFRISGSPAAPLAVGLRLVDSEIEIDDVDVSGAVQAGVEILGGGRAALRESHVHDNPGVGVLIAQGASPRLTGNLIAGNGRVPRLPGGPGGSRPGVEIEPGCRPLLADNRLAGNGGPQVRAPSAEAAAEIFAWNDFGGLPRERAVAVVAGAAGAGAAPQGTGTGGATHGAAPAPPAPHGRSSRTRPPSRRRG